MKTTGWAMVYGIRRDEEDWEDRRHDVEIAVPVEVHTLCWLCDQLEASWGYEFVTFTLHADDGALYRGDARGWRKCCTHGKWLCAPCAHNDTDEVPGSEWHQAPPRPSSEDLIDAFSVGSAWDCGREWCQRSGKKTRRKRMGERRATFMAIKRYDWETAEVRVVVRLVETSTVEHLCWFAELLEADGLEQVGFIYRETGAVYRGNARGWRLVFHDGRPLLPVNGKLPVAGEWHEAPPRPAGWDDLIMLEWAEWEPPEGWVTYYEDYSPSEGRA